MDNQRLDTFTLHEQVLIERISKFIRLRWVAITGTLVALAVGRYVFDLNYPWIPVLGTVGLILGYNILFSLFAAGKFRLAGTTELTAMRMLAVAQIVADLLALSALIHFLGGAENPFIQFYFFHMIIGSILFRPRQSYYIAAFASVLVNGIIWGEYFGVLQHYRYDAVFGPCDIQSLNFNLIMALILPVSFFLSVYFASSIANQLRRREEELELAYLNLQKVDDEKSYFMRKASHELRSPLGAIQSFISVLLDGLKGTLSDEQRNVLERMQIRIQGLLDLVNDLLRLSRLRVLDSVESAELFDFSEQVQQSVDLLGSWAKSKNISLTLQRQPVSLYGDKEGLREVISNLISNAIKYTPEGGKVDLFLEVFPERLRFRVEDNGIGICEEDQANLFKEFFRARNAKALTQAGTGLGLSIVKKVVEMHGGKIELRSALNQGTQVTVELPLSPPEEKLT